MRCRTCGAEVQERSGFRAPPESPTVSGVFCIDCGSELGQRDASVDLYDVSQDGPADGSNEVGSGGGGSRVAALVAAVALVTLLAAACDLLLRGTPVP